MRSREAEAQTLDVSGANDNPPQDAIRNALTTTITVDNLTLPRHRISRVLFEKSPVYISLYFSEVSELDTTERRSFRVYIDELPHSDPILLPYGSVKQVTIKNIDIYGTDEIVLRPTSDSTLSPILNAIEVYQVKDQKDGSDRD